MLESEHIPTNERKHSCTLMNQTTASGTATAHTKFPCAQRKLRYVVLCAKRMQRTFQQSAHPAKRSHLHVQQHKPESTSEGRVSPLPSTRHAVSLALQASKTGTFPGTSSGSCPFSRCLCGAWRFSVQATLGGVSPTCECGSL